MVAVGADLNLIIYTYYVCTYLFDNLMICIMI